MPPKKTRQNQIEREERIVRLAHYVRGGVTSQTRLARLLGVNQSTVSRDLRVVEEMFRQSAVEDIAVARGKDLERAEAMIAGLWHDAASGKWLAVDRVTKLLEYRSKVLGYDAPQRREISGPGGAPIQTVDLGALPAGVRDELYDRFRALLDEGGS